MATASALTLDGMGAGPKSRGPGLGNGTGLGAMGLNFEAVVFAGPDRGSFLALGFVPWNAAGTVNALF